MDRRKSLKAIALGTISTGLLVDACKEADKKVEDSKQPDLAAGNLDRMKEEVEHFKKISAEKFFTDHEMATITILGDIIIPRDEVSGSASDAGVPAFIEFIVKDMPQHQTPMRGGLRWLDLQSYKQFGKSFKDCSESERINLVDQIAYPQKAKPEMKQGVAFFSLMRNLTATGFYTSEIGVKDIGYVGNRPNQWNGVPADVLKQYSLSYTDKELKECISFDTK
ncbi:gluconate 2-dehydrogenase subunit 3 family protein [Flavihumibacter rivuli]|uniref:gluconate 2-dehydrogenase subunit 3 family protein n=1 Tax=Flavihumibacter rivuli TaxID=2838156 RepID=UPI001BDEE12A|nr:gluconate 2-dehydrogenase subunit 3 family protein [Flavihumibacter rivuli]ULQ58055.1 gluconate 2-dehydrogenase subunit 3 family protein [Flavihumibacter rivuli]